MIRGISTNFHSVRKTNEKIGLIFLLSLICEYFSPGSVSLIGTYIRSSEPRYFEFCTSFFPSCESQGANTRKRGRLSHMLRLIYLKVFFRAQTLDAWILLVCVWRIRILEFVVGFFCVFLLLFFFSGIRKMSGLWLHKFSGTSCLEMSSVAFLSVSAPSLLHCAH